MKWNDSSVYQNGDFIYFTTFIHFHSTQTSNSSMNVWLAILMKMDVLNRYVRLKEKLGWQRGVCTIDFRKLGVRQLFILYNLVFPTKPYTLTHSFVFLFNWFAIQYGISNQQYLMPSTFDCKHILVFNNLGNCKMTTGIWVDIANLYNCLFSAHVNTPIQFHLKIHFEQSVIPVPQLPLFKEDNYYPNFQYLPKKIFFVISLNMARKEMCCVKQQYFCISNIFKLFKLTFLLLIHADELKVLR